MTARARSLARQAGIRDEARLGKSTYFSGTTDDRHALNGRLKRKNGDAANALKGHKTLSGDNPKLVLDWREKTSTTRSISHPDIYNAMKGQARPSAETVDEEAEETSTSGPPSSNPSLPIIDPLKVCKPFCYW